MAIEQEEGGAEESYAEELMRAACRNALHLDHDQELVAEWDLRRSQLV